MLSASTLVHSVAAGSLARALAPFLTRSLLSTGAGRCAVSKCPAHATAELCPSPSSEPLPLYQEAVQNRCDQEYPEEVWGRILDLIPLHRRQTPVAVDFAVHAHSPAGLELARRGLNVLSVGGSALAPSRTLLHADTNADTRTDLIAAQLEPSVVRDGAADLVTCLGSLHLVDARAALQEAHRVLRPGGKLAVAFTDRDASHLFVDMVEEVTEAAAPSYSRATAQHTPQAWAPLLRAGRRFKLVGYSVHTNPTELDSLDALGEMMADQPGVAADLSGAELEDLKANLRALAKWGYGPQGPVVLPLQTRLFVLEKVAPASLQ